MNIKIFCRCSLFPFWPGKDLPALLYVTSHNTLSSLCNPPVSQNQTLSLPRGSI